MFHDEDTEEATYSDTLELDLSTVEPSLAGPKRPQDRVVAVRGAGRLPRRRSSDDLGDGIGDDDIARPQAGVESMERRATRRPTSDGQRPDGGGGEPDPSAAADDGSGGTAAEEQVEDRGAAHARETARRPSSTTATS